MQKFKITSACLIVALLFNGCSQQKEARQHPEPATAATESVETAAAELSAVSTAGEEGASSHSKETALHNDYSLDSAAMSASSPERAFIKTAQAEFKVKNVYQSALAIEDMVNQHGGFVTRNQIQSEAGQQERVDTGQGKTTVVSEYTTKGSLVVRVPSDKTQAFLRALLGQIEFLDSRSFEAKDAQFEILRQVLAYQRNQQTQSQLGNAAASGRNTDQKVDAIVAQDGRKLSRDEAMIAQKEFADQVAYSTIHLQIYQAPQLVKTEEASFDAAVKEVRPPFFASLWLSIKTSWYGVLALVVQLGLLWPLLLVGGLLAWGVRRYQKRRAAN